MKLTDWIFKPDPYTKIPGKKELTSGKEVVELNDPTYVYIPLTNHTNLNCQPIVTVGERVLVGQEVGSRTDEINIPMHASVSGEVVGIEKKWHRSGKQVPCIKIKNDFLYESDSTHQPTNQPEKLPREMIVELMRKNGVVGLGGSGFSTYIKYLKPASIHTVLINGVECEPYLTTDYHGIFHQEKRLFDGIEFLMKSADASRAIIAIKKGKTKLKAFLEEMVKHYGVEGILSIVEVPDAYPLGWEKVLIKTITGKDYDKLPAELGYVVSNVGTAIATSFAVRDNQPLIRRLVTVSGEGIKNPGVYDVRIGTPAKELIELAGGYVDEADEVNLIVGGPMMGQAMRNEDFIISRGVNGIIVLPTKKKALKSQSDCLKSILWPFDKNENQLKKDEQPCVKCGRCTDHCPVGLQPVLIKESAKRRDKQSLLKLKTTSCVECGMCSYICPSHIEVTEFIRRGKRILK